MTIEEAFRYCVENPDNLSIEQLLEKFPEYRAELEPLLAMDSLLLNTLPRTMATTRQAALKQRFLNSINVTETSEEGLRGPLQVTEPPASLLEIVGRPRKQHYALPHLPRRIAWTLAVAAILMLIIWNMAANALPDNPFYDLKLLTENGLLSFSNSGEAQGRSHIELANTRLYDLRSMQSAGKLGQAEPAFKSYIEHLQLGTTIWKSLSGAEHSNLSKLIYLSGVAGQQTFTGFSQIIASLPSQVQDRIKEIKSAIDAATVTSGQELQAARIDLDQLTDEAAPGIAALLTPVPGSTSPSVPSPLPTATLSPVQCLDSYEDDGIPEQAHLFIPGKTERHSFCPKGDADWFKFYTNADHEYVVETASVSPDVEPYIYLFDDDAKTKIGSSGDLPEEKGPAHISVYSESEKLYYFQVKNHGDIGYAGADYFVTIKMIDRPETPPVLSTTTP